jgi:hypothetical protein
MMVAKTMEFLIPLDALKMTATVGSGLGECAF